MFKYIFKSTTGSFFRTIGRIIAYALIGGLILFLGSFINTGNVHALDPTDDVQDVSVLYNDAFGTYIDPQGTYYKYNYAGDSGTRLGYLENRSYDSIAMNGDNTETWHTAITNFTYSTPFQTTSYNSSGISLSQCGLGFLKDNYYLVTYYFLTDTGVSLSPMYSNLNYKVGIGSDEVNANSNRNMNAYSASTSAYHLTFDTQFDITYFSVVIKPNRDGTCVNLAYSANSSTTTDKTRFVGYRYDYIGVEISDLDVQAAIDEQTQEINSNIDSMKEKQEETNNIMKDDKVDDAQNSANSFFGDFDDKDYGLSDIITMPLSFINNITSSTCTPLTIPLPFVDTNLTLPCMKNIYNTYFGDILNIYQTITFGIVAYWVCVNIFRMVKNFKDPDNDEIEVLDL